LINGSNAVVSKALHSEQSKFSHVLLPISTDQESPISVKKKVNRKVFDMVKF